MFGENVHVSMGINDFADFVFTKNYENKHIELNIGGLDDTKDLFCFCLDLMCKGLVLLFGKDNRVFVHELSADQFQIMREKLRCVGIDCLLSITPVELPPDQMVDLWAQNYLNMQRIRESVNSDRLEDYHFNLQTLDSIYKIKFQIMPRRIADIPSRLL